MGLIELKMKDMKNTNGFQDVFIKNVPTKKWKNFFIISNKVFDSTLEKTKYENKGQQQSCHC